MLTLTFADMWIISLAVVLLIDKAVCSVMRRRR